MGIPVRMKRAKNLVAIVLDSKEEMSGKLYNRYETEPEEFSGINELIHLINGFMDSLGAPGQMYKYRKFRKTKAINKKFDVTRGDKVHELTDYIEEADTSKTFAILIHTRDKATWQGAVYNASKQKSSTFKNEMELINIIKKF